MRMIPDTPHGTHSKAEKRLFDKLRSLDFAENHKLYTAYHSLNLTDHQYKRFGEIDFLITGPAGIFVLEVKGGRISCHRGRWEFTDRFGRAHQKVEGPFKQAESALHGLIKKLRANLPAQVINQFYIGYGVIFPDQQWNESGAEWDPHTLADARIFNNMEHWLLELFHYWQEKDGHQRRPDLGTLKTLSRYLRPDFETISPLYVLTSAAEDRATALTEDQMVMVDVVYANERVLCSGGAGTGKTFMAMELARRWTASGLNVLLVCKSPWLKNYLEPFAIPNLTVSVVDGVKTAGKRTGLDRFDALIVDEAQDLFEMKSLDRLSSVLRGGIEAGRWCFFHDKNNQSRLLGNFEENAFAYLSMLKTAAVPLRTNCRNTRVILNKVQVTLGADMGVRGTGTGPDIRETTCRREDAAQVLNQELTTLIEEGGLAPGNITILSPNQFNESCASLLPEQIREKIVILDEFAIRSLPLQQISFGEIANFKGLENEAVILVDLAPPDMAEDLTMNYVGMSRPRALLSLIYAV